MGNFPESYPETYQKLNREDKEVFEIGLKYHTAPELVKKSRVAFISLLCQELRDHLIPVVMSTVKKMHSGDIQEPKNASEVKKYVWAKFSKEEQDAFRKPTYEKNPEFCQQTLKIYAEQVVTWLIKLKEISEDEIEQEKKNIFNEHWNKLTRAYQEPNKNNNLS